MDTVQIEKLLAMKRYAKKQLLISNLVQYSLQASVLGLFLSSPSWLPRLYCTAKLLLSATMGPKCLFILSNIIIIFLVGESKISRPPPERDAYEDCAARSPGIRGGVESDAVDDQREESAVEDHPVEECRERDIVEVVEEEKVVVVVDEEREKGGVGEEEEEEEEREREVVWGRGGGWRGRERK
uniref:DUF4408 domain-containing protein n=1 Tax=Ananas comosus var. bracteatus TaxID=296719 RepID=A0A6V7NNH9_ANACO|nr:unnamed protein product [Ananas comosus var. bracteatus]